MIKKCFYHFCITMCLTISSLQLAVAGFTIIVENKSDDTYDVDVILTAAGFDAMYGRMQLGEVHSNQIIRKDYEYKYGILPLTGTDMPPSLDGCNLNMQVVAGPKREMRCLMASFKDILGWFNPPQLVEVEMAMGTRTRIMKGVRPPDIIGLTIARNSESDADEIRAKFANKRQTRK